METAVNGEILGQEDALRILCRALLRGEMGWVEPGRPRSFLLLLGETGVGKTESILVAARHLYSSDDYVIRLDMAEYAERATGLARLVGSETSSGLLAAEVRRVTSQARLGGACGILLLDEIEKAHPDVTRLFLGMEAGRLTTSTGELIDLTGFHIVCTTNLGSESARALSGNVPYTYLRRVVEEEARGHFSTAVFARFTETIVYRSLDFAVQRRICEQKLARKLAYIGAKLDARIEADANVVDHLLRRGYHRHLGARRMRHTIDREVGDAAVAQALADGPRSGKIWKLKLSPSGLVLEGE